MHLSGFITNTSQMSYPLPLNISKHGWTKWFEVSFLHRIFGGDRKYMEQARSLYPDWDSPPNNTTRPRAHSPWRAAEQMLTDYMYLPRSTIPCK